MICGLCSLLLTYRRGVAGVIKRGHAIWFLKRGPSFGGNILITDLRFSKNIYGFKFILWLYELQYRLA